MPPLSGFRIVEAGDESGAFAGRLLADLGAEVLRVECPEGDPVRTLAPFVDDQPDPEGGYFHLAFNAGKKSVALDLASEPGRTRFLELVGGAHGLIDAGPAGWLARLGVSDEELGATGAVRVSVTPFGLTGPWAERLGTDLIGAAAGGLAYVSGEPERPPIQAAGDVSHKLAGITACTAMVAGLRSGSRVHFDISVQECTAFSTLQTSNPNYWRWDHVEVPRNTAFEFPVVRCRDDQWAVMRARPDEWAKLREWAIEQGLPVRAGPDAWREATRAKVASFRLGEAADLVEELGRRYVRDEFLELGRQRGLLGLPLMTFQDMRANDHYSAIDELVTVRHPACGELELPKSPFAGMESVQPLGPAPLLGSFEDGPRPARSRPAGELRTLPLEGLRVLEIGWVLAGPLTCRILANLGAEVIKIESESRMDIRHFVPPPTGPTLTAGGWFNDANVGKRSASINTTLPEGRELLLRLASTCDIVVENMRPGALERMGLSYERLRLLNPRVIVAHMAGAGRDGPWAHYATFGNMITGASGLNVISGWEGSPPSGLGVAFADFVSPGLTASALIAAVIEREQTGRGQEIDMSQLPGMISLMSAEWMRFARTGTQEARRRNRSENHCPHGVFPAQGEDRWLAVAVRGDAEFARLATAIGAPELSTDARFSTHAARKLNEDALDAIVAAWTKERDHWEAADLLQAAGVPAAAVESIADQLDRDPQMAGRFEVVTQPTDPGVEITVHGEPIRIAGRENQVRRAPILGQDNEYVFREVVGLNEEEFVALLGMGVIG